MKVILNNEYYIEDVDDWNVILRRSYITYGSGKTQYEEPKLVTKDLGYYRTVGEALKGFLMKTRSDNTEDFNGSIEGYIKRIDDITNNAIERMERGIKRNGKN